MKYICTVCGYPDLDEKPANHEICPSCGTQFGYDDYLRSHSELRQQWIANDAQWFLKGYEPYGWNAYKQLQNAGFLELKDSKNTSNSVANARYQKGSVQVIEMGDVKFATNYYVIGLSANGLGCRV